MKYSLKLILLFCTLLAAVFAAEPVITVDLYGNVFKDGANTNQQIGDFARNNPQLAPQVDGAVRDAALAARKLIADNAKSAQDSAAAQVAAKEAEKVAAIAAAQSARDAAIAANADELAAAKSAREKLARHIVELSSYIEYVRLEVTKLGGVTTAPPQSP